MSYIWYKQGSEFGSAFAMWNLGLAYQNGTGCEKDEIRAFEWYRKSAELGDPNGMRYLGLAFENGIGCPQDSPIGKEWGQKAESQLNWNRPESPTPETSQSRSELRQGHHGRLSPTTPQHGKQQTLVSTKNELKRSVTRQVIVKKN